jgi:Glycosyl transferases group 1
VLAYHWDAVAATRTVRPPRLGAAVDFPQLAAWYRWRATPFRPSRTGASRLLWLQARLRRLPPLLVQLMNECEASANFAAHHAAWLKDNGAPECTYYRTPIEDRPGESWRSRRRRGERPRLLLIGHLRGTSTIEGLEVFARGVLPRLERALGADGFEVRIVGAYEPPAHLRAPLARPSVRFLGHLTQVDDEFLTADALLVPTSIRLGTRVRILTAWSFGCPVVAHVANADGIPELANEVNALLACDPAGLAEGVLRVVREPQLGEGLAEEGRRLYEACFAPAVAAEALLVQLERLAAARPVPIAA